MSKQVAKNETDLNTIKYKVSSNSVPIPDPTFMEYCNNKKHLVMRRALFMRDQTELDKMLRKKLEEQIAAYQ